MADRTEKTKRKGGADLRQLINRLIKWLLAFGLSGDEIIACLSYITDKTKEDPTNHANG